jgi:MFS family permease
VVWAWTAPSWRWKDPAIQSHLHASLLALAVSLIAIGKLGDRFGHKKVFLAGVTRFAASSAAIGLSGLTATWPAL